MSWKNNKGKIGFFEMVDKGTLFLDEIGELPLAMQTKLLRVLQDQEIVRVGSTKVRKIDVRIIAATNRNLEEEVREGRFRSDLFYRLRVAVLTIPPLREKGGYPSPDPAVPAALLIFFATDTHRPTRTREKWNVYL